MKMNRKILVIRPALLLHTKYIYYTFIYNYLSYFTLYGLKEFFKQNKKRYFLSVFILFFFKITCNVLILKCFTY